MKENFKFPQAVIFDKDGTVLSYYSFWYPVAVNATLKVLKKYGAPESLADNVMKASGVYDNKVDIQGVLCSTTYEQFAELVFDEIAGRGIDADKSAVVFDTVKALKESLPMGEILPTCEGMAKALERLKSLGVKLFVSTNDKRVVTKACLEKLEILHLLEEFITSDDAPSKPAPDGINYIIEKYGFDRDRVIMVGDTLTDLKYSLNAKVRNVAIGDSLENIKILTPYADVVLNDIVQVVRFIEKLKQSRNNA